MFVCICISVVVTTQNDWHTPCMEKQGFELYFHNRRALVWVLDSINALIPEANMHVDANSIRLKGMDVSHVGAFDIYMDLKQLTTKVECSNADGFDIGFTTKVFKSFISGFVTNIMVLQYIHGEDALHMIEKVDPTGVDPTGVETTRGKKQKTRGHNECKMNLIDLDVETMEIAALKDTAKIDISPKVWMTLIKEFSHTGEAITLECDAEKMICETKDTIMGERRRVLMHDGEVFIEFDAPDTIRLDLSLKQLMMGCEKVSTSTHEDERMRIEMGGLAAFHYYKGHKDTPECRISYYLAPRIVE